jgi:HD-GYP domain-containing protein (c-di-GMP phosphodiesterase class II)
LEGLVRPDATAPPQGNGHTRRPTPAGVLRAYPRPATSSEQNADDLKELMRVCVALTTERNVLTLLEMILTQARRITQSDAGSLYLVEHTAARAPSALRFKLSQNHSLPNLPLIESTVPIDPSSLAGYAAATGEVLIIPDVHLLPSTAVYRQNRSFDEKFGYRTKSVLVIPMKTHRDEIIGVLQLINRKRHADAALTSPEVVEREVEPFDQRSVELVTALAAQAAVAIENSMLYQDIERLFEGFVTAAVTAIEARDPTTYGHSGRVAAMSVALAEAVDRGGGFGAYRGTHFSPGQLRELRYAGLLHDFGKVGVREEILAKQKKLYPLHLDVIRLRFATLMQATEADFERARAEHLLRFGHEGYARRLDELETQRQESRAQLERAFRAVLAANEPTILPEGEFAELARLADHTYRDLDGLHHPVLTPDEAHCLTIRQGNLDEAERREIESHVMHTYRFLQKIPWTRELRGVPEIAFAHHEKLNGHGYPRAIAGDAIPVQTRIMTIADIYDALTASDRPYKKAVSPEDALDILDAEAQEGFIDRDLLGTFVEARVWDRGRGIN